EIGAADLDELQFRPFYDSGQAESADRRAEHFRKLRGVEGQPLSVATQQAESDDVIAHAADAVMIFSVHVVGDRAAERDKPSAWRRRKKPALWRDDAKNFRQGDARLRAQPPGLGVERNEPVEPAHFDQRAFAVEAGVAIGASQAHR